MTPKRRCARLAAAGQDIVIVNPSTPVGPGDVKPTPTGQMILDAARGKMPAYVDTGLNIVHVDDVAQGHLLALEKGRAGEAYILGGEDMMLRELLAMIARQTGRRAPKLRLPIAPLMPLAWAMERIAGLTGKTPLMTPDILKMARKKMFFSSAKARAELGYAPRPAEAAVADALTWFRTEGIARMIVFLALLIWLYLFFLHGRFWESGPGAAAGVPVPPGCGHHRARARRGRDDQTGHRLAGEPGLCREFPRHPGGRQFHRRHGGKGRHA